MLDVIGANVDWHRFKGQWKPPFAEQLRNRLADWLKLITWSPWREPKTLQTPVCLARVDLIVWDPIGIPKWSSKTWNGIVHHKSDRKLCVIPTADRNNSNGLWNSKDRKQKLIAHNLLLEVRPTQSDIEQVGSCIEHPSVDNAMVPILPEIPKRIVQVVPF